MIRNSLKGLIAALGLVVLCAVPAKAHTLKVTVTPTCVPCVYSLDVSGNSDVSTSVQMVLNLDITITSGPNAGTVVHDTKTISFTTDSSGNFGGSIPGFTNPAGCDETFTVSGTATLIFAGGSETFDVTTSVLSCGPPPPGKTFNIGPSSMEGHLLIRPGDWVSGGYSFKFVNGGHAATTVTVSSTITLPFRCANGTTGQFVINLGTHDYDVPAHNTDWQPTGDANSVLSWAGSGLAPDGCGSGNIMDNSKGAIFEATVSQNPDTGSLLNWRFKYRDPNAKGKGNVNCLDTSDPRRNKADVCGASWSETVRDP